MLVSLSGLLLYVGNGRDGTPGTNATSPGARGGNGGNGGPGGTSLYYFFVLCPSCPLFLSLSINFTIIILYFYKSLF